MQFPKPEDMRKRFHELAEKVKAVEAKSRPLRDKYDAIARDSRAKMDDLAKQFAEIEKPLYDMKMEMGMIARALGGKTGSA